MDEAGHPRCLQLLPGGETDGGTFDLQQGQEDLYIFGIKYMLGKDSHPTHSCSERTANLR